jgi:hypothetical protein
MQPFFSRKKKPCAFLFFCKTKKMRSKIQSQKSEKTKNVQIGGVQKTNEKFFKEFFTKNCFP